MNNLKDCVIHIYDGDIKETVKWAKKEQIVCFNCKLPLNECICSNDKTNPDYNLL